MPLVNSKIKSYRSKIGSYCPVIYDLTVDTTDTTDAGLFQTFGGELKNIRLANARIIGDGNVGGLVGKLNDKTEIDGCQVYLKNVKDENVPGDEIFTKHTRIDGAVSGGLVGDTDFSALTIKNSLAATIQWLAFASNAFNALAPFYTDIDTTPGYLFGTTGKVSTENFYWMSRMIAAMADASYSKSVFHIERYQEKVAAKSHEILNRYDTLLEQENEEDKRKKLQEEANEKLELNFMLRKKAITKSGAEDWQLTLEEEVSVL